MQKEKTFINNLIENAQDAIITIQSNGIIHIWNKSAEKVFGYSKNEAIGKSVEIIIPERYKTQHREGMMRFIRGGKPEIIGKTIEIFGKTKKGNEIPIEMSLSFQKDGEDDYSFTAIIRDITEKRLQENQITKLSRAVEQSPCTIVITDYDGKIEYANPRFYRLTGYSVEECTGKKPNILKSGKTSSEVYTELWKTIKSGKDWHGEFLNKKKNGELFWESASISPIKSNEGIITHFVAVKEDITKRKQMERQLFSTNNKLELLFSSIPSILIELSEDDKVSMWNSSAEKTFGLDSSDVRGKLFSKCDIQWDWDSVMKKVSSCKETHSSTWIDNLQYKRTDGSYGYLGITVNPITNEKQVLTGTLLLGSDITERRNMEQQLVHAQKMESIGQLAAGIAHEINTPTQYIMDNMVFLQDSFGDISKLLEKYSRLFEVCKPGSVMPELTAEIDTIAGEIDSDFLVEEIPNAIQQSLEGLERVKNIVYAMKSFSHPENENKKSVNINEAINNTLIVARNEWKYVAEVKTDFDSSLTSVPCYPGDFNQAMLNLIVNAAQAIGDVSENGGEGKGLITISTRHEGDCAEIRVSDTGTGIPEDVKSRIFDPFFTTKPVGKGTGQGLALAHSTIVGKHKGTITFDSIIGKGTTFIIRLPLDSSYVEGKLAIEGS